MAIPDAFEQLKPLFVDDLQHDYEAIRPIVLGAETVAERSRQTEMERTTLGDKARRFAMEGMRGLGDHRAQAAGRKGHVYPPAVAAYILSLIQRYPPIHSREIVRIVQRKFGYKTNHHTLKSFVARHAMPVQLELDLLTFSDVADAYHARWMVVRMAYEGWNRLSPEGGTICRRSCTLRG